MAPVGPRKFRRVPEGIRRKLEVAAAGGWERLVEAHASHALRFVALLASRTAFDDAISRYLDEMDLRDPMASSVRARVLIALQGAQERPGRGLDLRGDGAEGQDDGEGLGRFRPDVLVKGIARKYRENEVVEQWVALSMARAEEGLIRAHIENALEFAVILGDHASLDEAVEDYIELLKVTGGRAQAVFQRTMARLADIHLTPLERDSGEVVGPKAVSDTPPG